MSRFSDAQSIHRWGMDNVKNKPEPEGQKFPNGCRVYITDLSGTSMRHFNSACYATVVHTYAHAFGGSNVTSYCLDIDDYGQCSWYEEHQLTRV